MVIEATSLEERPGRSARTDAPRYLLRKSRKEACRWHRTIAS